MSDQEEKMEQEQQKQQEQQRKGKGKVAKVEKPKRVVLRVLKTAEHVPATLWTAHLHRMIKEANPALLKDPAVISAFHVLIEVLFKHQDHIHSFVPSANCKYLDGVNLDAHPEDPLRDICEVRWQSVSQCPETGRTVIRSRYYRSKEGQSTEEKAVRDEVIAVYRVLFDLVKGDVLPYMKRKMSEMMAKRQERRIQDYMERMDRQQIIHEMEMKRRQEAMKAAEEIHEQRMNHFRDAIARLSLGKE